MKETESVGWDTTKARQIELGSRIRALLESRGFPSVAAEGFKAPGVVVSYTTDDGIRTGKKFAEAGLQIAAGVPLMCDEPEDFKTFRLGLFGLDKLADVDRTVKTFEEALAQVV
jgi:aspartate aminotransferase-like enzyme